MAYRISILPGAIEDTERAYNWYEDQKQDLGEEFLAELEHFYRRLEMNPLAYKKVSKNFRQAAMKRFPYVIIFEVYKHGVLVSAVFHTSRNPKNKLRRR